MKRRTFIIAMSGGLVAAPLAAEAQQPGKMYRIGLLDYYLRTQTLSNASTNIIDAAVPEITGASRVGSEGGQLYGRYAVRARWDQMPSRHISFLLFPDSENWPFDGEIDWPEGNMGLPDMSAFVHPQNATTCCSNQLYYDDPSIDTSKWHDYTIEWTASAIRFYANSTLVGQDTYTSTIPHTPMHWVLQSETSLKTGTPADAKVNLMIDWVAAWAYAPGK